MDRTHETAIMEMCTKYKRKRYFASLGTIRRMLSKYRRKNAREICRNYLTLSKGGIPID
jgi:hypothetical protein